MENELHESTCGHKWDFSFYLMDNLKLCLHSNSYQNKKSPETESVSSKPEKDFDF